MKNLIENSTIHGITHIHSTRNKIYRTIWMILFMFGIGGIIVNIVIVSIKYFEYPVFTSYTLNHEPFIWPEFTFCNPTTPFYIEPNSSNHRDFIKLVKHVENSTNPLGKTDYILASADNQKLKVNFTSQIKYFRTYLDLEGIQSGTYENIHFLTTSYIKEVTISSKMVTAYHNLPCHTIKLKDELRFYSRTQLMKILFKLDYESYKIYNSDYEPRSLYLYINSVDEIIKGKPIILTPGNKYVLDIGQSRYQYLGVDRSCRKSNFTTELYDGNLEHTKLYEGNYDDCVDVMHQKYYMEQCKCYYSSQQIPSNGGRFPRLCQNITSLTKLEIQSNLDCFSKKINYTIYKKLSKPCDQYKRDKCDSISYKIDVQKEDIIDKSAEINKVGLKALWHLYSQLYPEDPDNKEFRRIVRENVIQIILNRNRKFGDLYKEQDAYNFSQLLSDVGGLMGLWLGMSVVGLFELAQLFYFYAKNLCKSHPEDNRSSLNIGGDCQAV